MTNNFVRRLVIVVALFLSGCAAVDKLNAPHLSGTPASSALVVAKVEASMHGMLGITSSQEVIGGVLLSTDGSRRIDGRAIAGLIIFADVPPGEYNLARVETNWRAGNFINTHRYDVPPESALDFIMSVKLGEPRFLGLITVEEFRTTGQRGVRFALKPSNAAELDAWAKFVELYQGSPWIGAVEKRRSDIRN